MKNLLSLRSSFLGAFCLAGTLFCSAGCSSTDPVSSDAVEPVSASAEPAAKADEKKAEPAVQKVGESLILAFMKDKPDLFISQLPEDARKDFTKKDFEITRKSMLEKLGEPVSYEFITNLEHPIATVSVWRIRFRRDSSDKSRKIYQETLFRAISGKIDGKDVLLSFNFL